MSKFCVVQRGGGGGGIITGFYTFWHWLKTPTWKKTFTAGICLGLLPLTKMTWIIVFPLWVMIWIIWVIPFYTRHNTSVTVPGWKQLTMVLFIGILTTNLGYAFDGSCRELRDYRFVSNALNGHGNIAKADISIGNRFFTNPYKKIPNEVIFPAYLIV